MNLLQPDDRRPPGFDPETTNADEAGGVAVGLFVLVGFLVSPTGLTNLSGRAGVGVAIGQALQVIGILVALVAGSVSTWTTYRQQLHAAGSQ